MRFSPVGATRGQFYLASFALVLAFGAGNAAQAQLTAPAITITPVAPAASPAFELAHQVLVQPSRAELELPVGYTAGTLCFSLLSQVNTEVLVRPHDSRLKFTGSADGKVRLGAYVLESLNFISVAPHSGLIDVLNMQGDLIAQVPYNVVLHRALSQSASLNYDPFGNRLSANYSVSANQTSSLAPALSGGVGLGYDFQRSKVGGNIYMNVRW